jgi:hypothetical protein
MPRIDSEVIQQYNDDGAAVIRGCISDHWLGVLNEAIEHVRLLHATVIARHHCASVLVGFELDVCGVSRLVCQCQFKHGDDSVGMETYSRVSERLR